jgi:hypothetical protein
VELPVASPSNRFLVPQRDRRWPHVLSVVLVMSVCILITLFLVGWPRLRNTSIHYDLIQLRAEVSELRRIERELNLQLEMVRSPGRLAEEAHRAGLVPPAVTDMVTVGENGAAGE